MALSEEVSLEILYYLTVEIVRMIDLYILSTDWNFPGYWLTAGCYLKLSGQPILETV